MDFLTDVNFWEGFAWGALAASFIGLIILMLKVLK